MTQVSQMDLLVLIFFNFFVHLFSISHCTWRSNGVSRFGRGADLNLTFVNHQVRYAFVYGFTVTPGLVVLRGTCPRLACNSIIKICAALRQDVLSPYQSQGSLLSYRIGSHGSLRTLGAPEVVFRAGNFFAEFLPIS